MKVTEQCAAILAAFSGEGEQEESQVGIKE